MRLTSLIVPAGCVVAGFLCTLSVTAPAHALPPASGSKCDSSWVNNPGAMACFIKGEDESHAGVKHPHYVACVGGDTFCCVDNDAGHQDCVAQARGGHVTPADWTKAILAAHQTMTMRIGRFGEHARPLQSEIPQGARTAAAAR